MSLRPVQVQEAWGSEENVFMDVLEKADLRACTSEEDSLKVIEPHPIASVHRHRQGYNRASGVEIVQ
jgi:hypothetical protein